MRERKREREKDSERETETERDVQAGHTDRQTDRKTDRKGDSVSVVSLVSRFFFWLVISLLYSRHSSYIGLLFCSSAIYVGPLYPLNLLENPEKGLLAFTILCT